MKKSAVSDDSFIVLQELLSAINYRRRFIRYSEFKDELGAGGSLTGFSQVHILLHVDSYTSVTVKDLSEALNLEKSTISRLVSGLEKNGFISCLVNKRDKRSKTLSVTKKGRKMLCLLDKSEHRILNEFLVSFNSEEESELCHYYRILADGLGAKPLKARPSDHMLTLQHRRISRTAGRYTNSSVASLTYTQVVTLKQLANMSSNPVTMADLKKTLPFDASTVSRSLAVLQENKLISKNAKSEVGTHHRTSLIKITAKGAKLISEQLNRKAKALALALTSLSEEQVDGFIFFLKRILDVKSEDTIRVLDSGLRVALVKSEEERKILRGFIVEQYVRLNQHFDLPECLIASESFSFGLYSNKRLRGVIEVKTSKKEIVIVNFSITPTLEGDVNVALFVESALEQVRMSTGLKKILFSPDCLAPEGLRVVVRNLQ